MKPKHLLFLMTDQHRADHVGWHPQARVATPHLNRVAEGTRFARCITPNPICTPARTALLTGKYTHQIGMLEMSGDLHPQHPTYPQALQQAGYYTAAVGKMHWLQTWEWGSPRGQGVDLIALKETLKRTFGWDYLWESEGKQLAIWNRGDYALHLEQHALLEAYRDHASVDMGKIDLDRPETLEVRPFPFGLAHQVDVLTADKALEVLVQRPRDRPLFLFVSFCGPHPPYDPPPEYWEAEPTHPDPIVELPSQPLSPELRARFHAWQRAYRAMIRLIDDQVGRILEALEAQGMLDETVILFSSDHGEMLGDRRCEGKSVPYRSSVQVPAAIRHPEFLSKRTIDSPVELTDLTATLLEVAGLDAQTVLSRRWPRFHDCVPCRSLLPLVRGEAETVRAYAFSECGDPRSHFQMIQSARYKYIRWAHTPSQPMREELYDLHADPDERHDLAGQAKHQQTLEEHRQALWRTLDLTPPAQTSWAPLPGSQP